MLVRMLPLTRNDRTVVQKLQETATVSGKNDLLFGSLDGGKKFSVVSFLELLAGLSFNVSVICPLTTCQEARKELGDSRYSSIAPRQQGSQLRP